MSKAPVMFTFGQQPSAAAAATHGSFAPPDAPAAAPDRLALTFEGGQTLAAGVAALRGVSRVLRVALAFPLSPRGVLPLRGMDDDPDAWAAVVRLAELSAHPTALVTWDNIGAMLRLADKYDMPAVGAACADFLLRNPDGLRLSAPLRSPANTLMAASIVDRYCGGGGGGGGGWDPPVLSMAGVLRRQLGQNKPGSAGVGGAPAAACLQLRALVEHRDYPTAISPAVQVLVTLVLLDALDALDALDRRRRTEPAGASGFTFGASAPAPAPVRVRFT
ncbi:hypothetical protein GPECTOR_3g266 [Gonium pectorale]|uniref:BTB domain-containing protein n=1 Tax=Gonium pectorale TaxID=33097 RepID=A0A150GZC9_GONPE|nr:hypothetical protein GPECTOR_3g266 [Gonium pectorale]|eukprot:KXZ55113.1 hypothetical protein GPECTOR_3g266 [Gonium pectorale]